MVNATAEGKPGYNKIRFYADQAWRDGLRHCWIDTCCIDNNNAVEVQEAINCMFRWYRRATKFSVYLAGFFSTSAWESPFHGSIWSPAIGPFKI
jgi:hypothetical protein